jgi:hypothetical protein
MPLEGEDLVENEGLGVARELLQDAADVHWYLCGDSSRSVGVTAANHEVWHGDE